MLDPQRIVHLNEISAIDIPAIDRYKYKCRVQMASSEGETLLQRDLFARMQPSWLVELKNRGDCTISITFCCREGDISHPWQDVGTVTFATQECLNGDPRGNGKAARNADLEFPITTWNRAPQLKLKVRLTQSASEGNSSTVTLFGKQNGARRRGRDDGSKVEVELPQTCP